MMSLKATVLYLINHITILYCDIFILYVIFFLLLLLYVLFNGNITITTFAITDSSLFQIIICRKEMNLLIPHHGENT